MLQYPLLTITIDSRDNFTIGSNIEMGAEGDSQHKLEENKIFCLPHILSKIVAVYSYPNEFILDFPSQAHFILGGRLTLKASFLFLR